MADPRQQMMDAVLAGTFDRLDTTPRQMPGYTLNEIYGPLGIPPAPNVPRVSATSGGLAGAMASGSGAANLPRLPAAHYAAGSYNPAADQSRLAPGWPWQNPLTHSAYGNASAPGTNNPALGAIGMATTPNVNLPRPRPGSAPNRMDIAAMGNKSLIDAALRGDMNAMTQLAQSGGLGGNGGGGQAPNVPPAPMPNFTTQRSQSSNGYIYGRSGNGPWHQQGKAPWAAVLTPQQQYDVANAAAALAAKINQARSTGVAGAYQYQNGQRVGLAPQYAGMSPSQAYAAANANAQARAAANAVRPPYRPSGGSGFSSSGGGHSVSSSRDNGEAE